MLEFPAPKTMAKALRVALAERGVTLSHAQCLDLVARQCGFPDWNVLAPRLETDTHTMRPTLPEGWFPCGSFSAADFRLGTAPEHPGTAMVEAIGGPDARRDTFAGLMQSVSAEAYRGRRVRLSATLRSRDVGAGTIWLRVDAVNQRQPLVFDNMMRRNADGPLAGTCGWADRAIVLDVPEAAESLHFGFFLTPPGILWTRGMRLDIVGPETPVTVGPGLPPGPSNLDFH